MAWNPITLRGISVLGPEAEPAVLNFVPGLNVIAGASETGKSFIVETINFLLGSGRPLRDIKAREGYDQGRLVFETTQDETLTLRRSTAGGHFGLIRWALLTGPWPTDSETLRRDGATATEESISRFLLSKIDLQDKILQQDR